MSPLSRKYNKLKSKLLNLFIDKYVNFYFYKFKRNRLHSIQLKYRVMNKSIFVRTNNAVFSRHLNLHVFYTHNQLMVNFYTIFTLYYYLKFYSLNSAGSKYTCTVWKLLLNSSVLFK